VSKVREAQLERFREAGIFCNAQMGPKEITAHCALDDATMKMLESAIQRLGFSARAYDRILKVSRTIADLAGSAEIRACRAIRPSLIALTGRR
jgi:magnesium chelatase family protein